MSASSKKKLRNADDAKKLTEKQLAEQKEARKLQLYTVLVVTAVVLIAVAALCIVVTQAVSNSGVRERSTVAATVGDHQISNAELSYYYLDSVNNFVNNYGSYAAMFGLDVTKALDEQYYDEEAGQTWADYFISGAIDTAKNTYALADAAASDGYSLSESEQDSVDSTVSTMAVYAKLGGYSNTKQYLKAIYGNGATEESYRTYVERSVLADSYAKNYAQSLTYTDEQLRAEEQNNYNKYSVYSYNSYFVSASKFLEGGTTNEDGKTTYSELETNASVVAAQKAAKELAESGITDVEALDAAIAAMDINKDTTASSTAYTDTAYDSINSVILDWVTSSSRKAGDITSIESTTVSTDENGNETVKVSGYYVVLFRGSNDNNYPLANVRHILVTPEGGTTDSNGNVTYSDEEMAAAKAAAEEILATWQSGEATEDSFAALASEKSDDPGSKDNGGLYEDVYPGQMVAAFNDWCFTEGRKSGDTGIVETEYGCHVMYYSGDSDTTYRDYLIKRTLSAADYSEWYTALTGAVSTTTESTKYLRTDIVLSST